MLVLAVIACSCQSGKKVADADNSPFYETKWNLSSIEGEYIDSTSCMTKPYIVFFDDGTFTGNLGCNTFFGSYFQKKQKIELTFEGATKKLCANMGVERAMMKALKKEISQFEISGKTLILYQDKDEIMRFNDGGGRIVKESGE